MISESFQTYLRKNLLNLSGYPLSDHYQIIHNLLFYVCYYSQHEARVLKILYQLEIRIVLLYSYTKCRNEC